MSKMRTGYPRFFIHLTIQELQREVLRRYGRPDEATMLFPSAATAKRCQRFFFDKEENLKPDDIRIIGLVPHSHHVDGAHEKQTAVSRLYCIFFPKQYFPIAKQVWQHSGDGISSRRGEFCLKALQEGLLVPESESSISDRSNELFRKGPRRYQRGGSLNGINHNVNHSTKPITPIESTELRDGSEFSQFVEERFGRNLNAKLASKAKVAVRRRIAGCFADDVELEQPHESAFDGSSQRIKGLTEDDVYLYPAGMSAIFNTYRILRVNNTEPRKSICFGFPYVDTLKILQKWGPGCLFYGNGWDTDLDDLEHRLESGERYLALFTEFPGNPLLDAPNLVRIRQLADKYNFAVVVDESVGNFINVNVLSQADIVVSSLTKVFSGDSNVMGGSAVLNPHGPMYHALKKTIEVEYEDNYWAEDAVFMERNSRDFMSRIERINVNGETIAAQLHASPIVKQVYYPSYRESRKYYDACRNPNGGYGGLLSVTFHETEQAVVFYDALEVHKGPSLGTNFTLSCPYTILAHYGELEWAASFGVETDLIRISFGLEDTQDLKGIVERALQAAERITIALVGES